MQCSHGIIPSVPLHDRYLLALIGRAFGVTASMKSWYFVPVLLAPESDAMKSLKLIGTSLVEILLEIMLR